MCATKSTRVRRWLSCGLLSCRQVGSAASRLRLFEPAPPPPFSSARVHSVSFEVLKSGMDYSSLGVASKPASGSSSGSGGGGVGGGGGGGGKDGTIGGESASACPPTSAWFQANGGADGGWSGVGQVNFNEFLHVRNHHLVVSGVKFRCLFFLYITLPPPLSLIWRCSQAFERLLDQTIDAYLANKGRACVDGPRRLR